MSQPLAILDTSVLVLLLSAPGSKEPDDVMRRREKAEVAVKDLQKKGARFAIPTPVLAELCKHGKPDDVIRRRLVMHIRRTKTLPLGADAAVIAGEMALVALKNRPQSSERGAVKYDTLIAAIAHWYKARWLVTDNRPDMKRCLETIQSTVELIVTSDLPKAGQLHLIHALQK